MEDLQKTSPDVKYVVLKQDTKQRSGSEVRLALAMLIAEDQKTAINKAFWRLPEAVQEGVDGLLAARALSAEGPGGAEWRSVAAARVASDELRHAELRRVTRDWLESGVDFLLLKGGGLAYTHYPHSWLRPQEDVDVWCDGDHADRIAARLHALGYERIASLNSEATHQRHFLRTEPSGVSHQVEVHLRLANVAPFSDALSYTDARAASVGIESLGGSRTLGPPHALLLACMHRVAHHFNSTRLIWLYDIHLLATAMSAEEWTMLIAAAERAQMRAVCLAGVSAAAQLFGTAVPERVVARWRAAGPEPSARFLHGQLREIDLQWANLRQAGWRTRARMIRARLFPPLRYMRSRYPGRRDVLMPWLYVYRIASRLPAWFVPYPPGRR
jgi:hypothetical protein